MNAAEQARYAQAGQLMEDGRLEQARAMALRALAATPDSLEWLDLTRAIFVRLRQPQQALYYALKAAALAPDHPGVVGELAYIQHNLGKVAEAEANFRRSIAAEPGYAQARSALLAILIAQDRLAEAEPIARDGLALEPDHGELNMKLGAIEMETLRMREAFERLAAMRFRHGGGQLAHQRLVEYQATLANYAGLYAEDSGELLTPRRIAALHREAGQVLEPSSIPHRTPAPPRSSTGALRVAVVSPDFRRHPVAFFIEPLLRHADRRRIELIGISTGTPDEVTPRLKAGFAQWHEAAGLSPPQFCRTVREARPDVLLELAGFTISHFLAALAEHPAPVQATYLDIQTPPAAGSSTIGSSTPSPTRPTPRPTRSAPKSSCVSTPASSATACRTMRRRPPPARRPARSPSAASTAYRR